jgi:hypothetical protein
MEHRLATILATDVVGSSRLIKAGAHDSRVCGGLSDT